MKSRLHPKPSALKYVTCDYDLWKRAQHPSALASDCGKKYGKVVGRHADKLEKLLKFEEDYNVSYVVAEPAQCVNLRSFGRDGDDYIYTGKFPGFTEKEVKDAFLEGYDNEELLVSLTTFEINKKYCCLSICIPFYDAYLRLVKNLKGFSGLMLQEILDGPELKHIRSFQYEQLADREIPIVKHHLKILDGKWNGPKPTKVI